MSTITTTFRYALAAAALCGAAGSADAKPRRIVILDFDGPRELVDTSTEAVREALSEYDLIATKRWEKARVDAQRTGAGPATWAKAAKASGVDAVIEGWVQDEGRHKMLTVIVRDASNGTQHDQLTIKVGPKGLSPEAVRALHDGLEDRLAWIESLEPPVPQLPVRRLKGAKSRDAGAGDATAENDSDSDRDRDRGERDERDDRERDDRERDGRERDDRDRDRERDDRDRDVAGRDRDDDRDRDRDRDRREPPKTEVAAVEETKPACFDVFGDCSVKPEEVLGLKEKHVPRLTKRFIVHGGGYYGSRSLHFDADNITNIEQFDGVASKGIAVGGAIYPFPRVKWDGQPSGIGFSIALYHSAGALVGIDTDDTTGEYSVNQNGWVGAIHWRQPLGIIHLDGEVGYSRDNYIINDPPEGYEVPDTEYSAFHAGVHLDLSITQGATVGFGGKMFYVLDTGMISSTDFFGPGSSSGFALDAGFHVPLPKDLFVRGDLAFKRYKTKFAGGGIITDEDGVTEGVDSTLGLNVNFGIQF